MHQYGALAYQQTARKTASPREVEANLLSKSAIQLQRIRDNWDDEAHELDKALTFNRRLWSIFIQAVTRDENPSPAHQAEHRQPRRLRDEPHLTIMTQPAPQSSTRSFSSTGKWRWVEAVPQAV